MSISSQPRTILASFVRLFYGYDDRRRRRNVETWKRRNVALRVSTFRVFREAIFLFSSISLFAPRWTAPSEICFNGTFAALVAFSVLYGLAFIRLDAFFVIFSILNFRVSEFLFPFLVGRFQITEKKAVQRTTIFPVDKETKFLR